MLCRRDVAQECRAVHCGNGAADGTRDVVIARCDVGDQRSEDIERCAHAQRLLYFHVCRNLVERNVTRTLDHDLYVVRPCALGQLAQTNQLLDLADIGRVSQTARTAGVAQRYGDVILLTDVQNLVKVLVERVLLAGHAHPGKDKAAAAADDVHLTLVLADLLNGLAGDAAVQGDKVHAVLSVQTDNVDEVLCGQRRQIALIVDNTVVDRYGADHRRALAGQLAAERLGVAVAGQIHDRLSAHVDRAHNLLHLDVVILAVAGYAEVDVDLGAQHAADTLRIQTGVVLVRADRNLALCDQLHQLVDRHVLLLCDGFNLRCDDTAACGIHLCGIVSHDGSSLFVK